MTPRNEAAWRATPTRMPALQAGACMPALSRRPYSASMRSTARRAPLATAGSIVTSRVSVSSARRIFGSVIRFMCGHRLQGRTNSISGMLDRDVVAHRAFGHQHDARRLLGGDIVDHRGGRAGEIGFRDDLRRAFGMREHDHAGMLLAQRADLGGGEALMHLAMALPGDDLDVGFGRDVAGREIRREA